MSNKKHLVSVDSEKCIGCGLCSKDCPSSEIEIIENKAVVKNQNCIVCGHCEAICPKAAVSISGFEDKIEEYENQTRLNANELMDAIKTRRTIRQFKNKDVPEEIIDMIIESGRLAPTGTNAQATSYLILKDKKDEVEKVAIATMKKLLGFAGIFVPALKGFKIDEGFLFKKAPAVIVILGSDKVSASLAAENMAFMAEANGLGVLFSGFFTICYNMKAKIRKMCGMKKSLKAVTTLVIGYQAVEYKRTVHRKPAKIFRA